MKQHPNTLTHCAIATLAAVAFFAGCNKKEEATKAAPAKVEAAKAGDKAKPTVAGQAKAGAGEAADCDSYANSLCDIAGKEPPTCESIRTTLKILPAAACKAGMTDLEYSRKQMASLGRPCEDLIAKLCGDLGAETQTCGMVKGKTKQFGAKRCADMMKNYPKVLGELKRMELC